MKTYVIGDIHGYLKSLKQCLLRSGFDFENDRLICLGDVADRGPETYECFELLLTIKNLVYILGNHDWWLLQYFNNTDGVKEGDWLMYGGKQTLASYRKNTTGHERHHQLLKNAHLYYLDENKQLFVHGGFDIAKCLDEQTKDDFCWDRMVWYSALTAKNNIGYQINKNSPVYTNHIFVGHTSTHRNYPDLLPKNFVNIWNLDQGAGHGYKLTIMDVDNFKYWQSDLVSKLYNLK